LGVSAEELLQHPPGGSTAIGAPSAATSVGAMSIKAGGDLERLHVRADRNVIVPSIRWSPLTRSASSSAVFEWVNEVALVRHHQDVGCRVSTEPPLKISSRL
jgi:hypothetical protein